MSNGPKIAIIGAGPAGLTLARLLQHNKIACTIYEYETSRDARGQGGSLDLHEHTGQLALREAGLWDEWLKYRRVDADVMKLLDQNGRVLLDESETAGSGRNRPEIDRHRLREILLNSVDPASIKWGEKLVKVEPNAETKDTYDLHFVDGVEYGFDLVVGADGAWSRVRPLLTDVQPYYSGITGVVVGYPDVVNRKQEVAKLVGAGSCFAFGDNRSILSQTSGEGGVLAYAMLRVPETWGKDSGIDWKSPSAIQKVIDGYYSDWAPELKDLLLNGEDPIILRPLYMLPIGIEWAPRPGVTLLGDAAHLMTPFAGVGVNVAMEDALKLAKAIISRRESWLYSTIFSDRTIIAAATREYEGEMFPRAKGNAEGTWRGLEMQFSENAAPKVLAFFQKMAAGGPPEH